MAPKVFHVPGVPAVTQTAPMFPAATGVVNIALSPIAQSPFVGAAL